MFQVKTINMKPLIKWKSIKGFIKKSIMKTIFITKCTIWHLNYICLFLSFNVNCFHFDKKIKKLRLENITIENNIVLLYKWYFCLVQNANKFQLSGQVTTWQNSVLMKDSILSTRNYQLHKISYTKKKLIKHLRRNIEIII